MHLEGDYKNMSKRQMKYLLAALLLLIISPTVYVTVLNAVLPHPGLNLSTKWSNETFEDWNTDMTYLAAGNVTTNNDVLSITIAGKSPNGAIVAAQRKHDLPSDLSQRSFLKVTVKTSSIDVAARVVIWANASYSQDVLIKTYSDREWHTEIVDLTFFDIPESIYMVELSAMKIYASTDNYVSYTQLTFEEMEV